LFDEAKDAIGRVPGVLWLLKEAKSGARNPIRLPWLTSNLDLVAKLNVLVSVMYWHNWQNSRL